MVVVARSRLALDGMVGVAKVAHAVLLCADEVPLDHVAGSVNEENTAGAVPGDQVPGPGQRAADRVGGGAFQVNPFVAVGEGDRAGQISTNAVALDHVPGRPVADRGNSAVLAVVAVAGDQVARAGSRAADEVAWGAGDADAGAVVLQGGCPRRRSAYDIPLDNRVRRSVQEDTVRPFPEITLPAPATAPPTVFPADTTCSAAETVGQGGPEPVTLGPI